MGMANPIHISAWLLWGLKSHYYMSQNVYCATYSIEKEERDSGYFRAPLSKS